jgi:glycosyltransferase involved in cell wall biosynthesis
VQRLFRTVVAAMDRCGAAVLGYSSQALRYFDRIGIPAERQFRALNCVDTDQVLEETVRVRDRVEPLREELGLAGRRVVLFVGALAPYKRVEDLIAVYADLRRAHGDLALLIVGGGSHRAALERCARAEAAEDVVFSGEVLDGVAAYFELGSVFVLPGLGGLAISEAMCHGLPVIAPEADGTERDLIEDGKSGFLVSRGDRAQLRDRLEQLLADPDRSQRMGERSRWLIEHRYNIGTLMESLVEALVYAHGGDRRPSDAVESGPAAR